MSGSFRVRVPASSANLGPGFDALGMALSLYLVAGVDGESAPTDGARVVDAHHREAVERHVLDEVAERVLHRVEGLEVIEMFGIDIGDDGDVGRQLEEGAVALVGLDHHPFAGTELGVGAERRDAIVAREPEVPHQPEPVREVLKLWRPSPLFRARRLEQALDTPAHIYYKYEGVSPAGSHKPNTAIAQAFYNKAAGVKRLATETGAGQWGTSLSLAGALFGLEVKVYMVRASYDQKPYRRNLMETWGAKVVASPSPDTEIGRTVLAKDPNHTGSLGLAISEAVMDAVTSATSFVDVANSLGRVPSSASVIGSMRRSACTRPVWHPGRPVGGSLG